MFKNGEFTSHAGKKLSWKIECDSLDRNDITTICELIASKFAFKEAYCPVTNSHFVNDMTRFLNHYHATKNCSQILIVDDVLTTGKSMEERRQNLIRQNVLYSHIKGVVLFSRGECPRWITPIFTLNKKFK